MIMKANLLGINKLGHVIDLLKNVAEQIIKERRKIRIIIYEARVRFETRVRVRVRVRDSAIFEKSGCGCGRTRRLKNY